MVTSLLPIQIGQAAPDGAGGRSGRQGGEAPFAALIALGAEGASPSETVSTAEHRDGSAAPWVFPWLIPASPLPDPQPGPALPAGGPAGDGPAVVPEMALRAPDPSGAADPTARPVVALPAGSASPVALPGRQPMAPAFPPADPPARAAAPEGAALPAGFILAVRPKPSVPVEAAHVPAPSHAAGLAASVAPAADPVIPLAAAPEGRLPKPAAVGAGTARPAAILAHPSVALLRRLSAAAEEGAPVEPTTSSFRPTSADPAAPARPAPAVETARPASPSVQVALAIIRAAHGVPGRLVVELVPHELGRVEIAIESERRGGRTRITADRRETLDLLMTEARVLEKALTDAGIDPGRRGIEFSLRGDGGRGREPPSPQTPPGRGEEPPVPSRPGTAPSPAPGLPASRSGLDILV